MSTVTSTNPLASTTGTASTPAKATSEASDRFLKLLVTQMQNQDPLNPMDNAQVTSQMAQINTVTGIEKLNTTMGTMSTSFAQMQMMQGVSLVGHDVLVDGNKLQLDADKNGVGGFELSSGASSVTIEIKTSSGAVIDNLKLGAQTEGQHGFSWKPPTGMSMSDLTFNVKAVSGGTAVTSIPLMTDTVDAVRTKDGGLNLQLRQSGDTPYSKVRALS